MLTIKKMVQFFSDPQFIIFFVENFWHCVGNLQCLSENCNFLLRLLFKATPLIGCLCVLMNIYTAVCVFCRSF